LLPDELGNLKDWKGLLRDPLKEGLHQSKDAGCSAARAFFDFDKFSKLRFESAENKKCPFQSIL
jgi:hypothetical protein